MLATFYNWVFARIEHAKEHHTQAPMFGSLVHVRGKNISKGLAKVRGKARGEDPHGKYYLVQYEGEEAMIIERSDLFLIHI